MTISKLKDGVCGVMSWREVRNICLEIGAAIALAFVLGVVVGWWVL